MADRAAEAVDTRRFRVRADAFYVRHGDGVWLRNNVGSFSIQGAGAYQLVAALFENLDGRRTLEEIVGGLPEVARTSVLRLVDMLARNGFIKLADYPVEVVPDWMRELHSTHLAFLEHHANRPVARMMRVRSQQVVCVGEGVALRSLLGALGEFGIAKVLVVTTGAGADELADVIGEARRRDPRLRWRATLLAGDSLDLAEAVNLAEVRDAVQVLLAVDHGEHTVLAAAQQSVRSRGQAVGLLGRCGDFVVSVPPSSRNDWCWECVHRCVAGQVNGDAADLAPAVAPASIAALHLVQHAFALLAEVELDGQETATLVEPLAPVVRTHRGRRHPLCPRHGGPPAVSVITDWPALSSEPVRPDIPASRDPADLVAVSDRIVSVTTAWTDQVMGPLLAIGEGGHEQLPLSASSCRVADPASTADARLTRLVVCRASSPREARNQVVLFALEWVAARVVTLGRVSLSDEASDKAPDEAGDVYAYGAGWTAAEALYRAWLAASADLPPGTHAWVRVSGRSPAAGRLREFLAGTLAAAGRSWGATAIEGLPTGLFRARVRTGDDQVAHGMGIDENHAVDNALLRAVSAGLPGAGTAVTAHLAPPVDTWADAVAIVAKQGGDAEAVDISRMIPAVAADAFVVATRIPAETA